MARTGKYFEEGAGRAGRVEALFGRIASRYDLFNDLQTLGLHRLWKRRMVRLAQVSDGGRVLDLCCGTGDVVRALAERYPGASLIAGLDFSMPMLRIASLARPRGRPRARIVFVRADALGIPFADGSFDAVTIAYGLRNVASLDRGLAEARRVLRPGGRLVILDFGKPDNPVVSRAYFAYLRTAVPLFGRIFFGDPETTSYIHDSLLRFPSQRELADRLVAAGFARVSIRNPLLGGMGLLVGEV